MELEILSTKKEPLMKRTHFTAKVVFSGKTPSRIELKKDLVSKLGSKDNLTLIRTILADYGSERAKIEGFYYDDETIMNKIENRFVKLRHLGKAERNSEKEKIKQAKLAKKDAKKAAKKKK